MVADYLASFTNVASIEWTTDGVEHDGGWGFLSVETSVGGSECTLGWVISRDDGGGLRIAEV